MSWRPVDSRSVATALPTIQNSRPSRASTRHSKVSAWPSTSSSRYSRAPERMVRLGGRDGRERLADEVGEVAAEHPARRAVHPLDAARPDVDDADQHRVEDRARALGLQRHRALGAMARVDVDVRGDDAAGGRARSTSRLLICAHDSRPSRRRSWRSPLQRPCRRRSRSSSGQRRSKSALVDEQRFERRATTARRPTSRSARPSPRWRAACGGRARTRCRPRTG